MFTYSMNNFYNCFIFILFSQCIHLTFQENLDFQSVLFDARCLASCLTQYSTMNYVEKSINTAWPIFQGTYSEDILVCYYSCSRCNDEYDNQVIVCEKSYIPSCVTGLLFCKDETWIHCNGTRPSKPLLEPTVRFLYTSFHTVEISWNESRINQPSFEDPECKSYTTFILRVKSLNSILYYMVSNYIVKIQLFNNLVKTFTDSLNISVGSVNKDGFSGFGPENYFRFGDSDPGPVTNLTYNFTRNDEYPKEYQLLLKWDIPTINYQNLYSFSISVGISSSSFNTGCSEFYLTQENQTLNLDKSVTKYLFKHVSNEVGPVSNCIYDFRIISLFSIFFNSSARILVELPLLCDKPIQDFETSFYFLPYSRQNPSLRIGVNWNSQTNLNVIYRLELSIFLINPSTSFFKISEETNSTFLNISPISVAVDDIFYPPISIKYKIEAKLLHELCLLSFEEGEVNLTDSFPSQPIHFNAFIFDLSDFESVLNLTWSEPLDFGGPLLGYQLSVNSTLDSIYYENDVFNFSHFPLFASIHVEMFAVSVLKLRAENIYGFGEYTDELFVFNTFRSVPSTNSSFPDDNIVTIIYSVLFPTMFMILVITSTVLIFVIGYFCFGNFSKIKPLTDSSKYSVEGFEIPLINLYFLQQTLGTGAFGLVQKAIWKENSKNSTIVAVKLTRDEATDVEVEDLFQEICLMKKIGTHPRIVKFLGCVVISRPICLVLEFIPFGDLLSILRKLRGELNSTIQRDRDSNYLQWFGLLTTTDLINFSFQISDGMEYISSLKLVHRDLACRNILVAENKQLKISDFGLARELNADYSHQNEDKEYYRIQFHNDKLPIRWMAIESISEFIFTSKSDVWSFGITLWEIASLGTTPYSKIPNSKFIQHLFSKNRPEIPSNNCLPEIYQLMKSCWNEDPIERPNFSDLKKIIFEIKIRHANQSVFLRTDSNDLHSVDFDESFNWDISNSLTSNNEYSRPITGCISNQLKVNDCTKSRTSSLSSLNIIFSPSELTNYPEHAISNKKGDIIIENVSDQDVFKDHYDNIILHSDTIRLDQGTSHLVSKISKCSNTFIAIKNQQYLNVRKLLPKSNKRRDKLEYNSSPFLQPSRNNSDDRSIFSYLNLSKPRSSPKFNRRKQSDSINFEILTTKDENGIETEL